MHNFQSLLRSREAPERTLTYTSITADGNRGDEEWDPKVGEDAVRKCASTNTFNAIVETNGTSERVNEGIITNPSGEAGM
jgi:hypothetical protein